MAKRSCPRAGAGIAGARFPVAPEPESGILPTRPVGTLSHGTPVRLGAQQPRRGSSIHSGSMRPTTGAQGTVSRSNDLGLDLSAASEPDCIAMPPCRCPWVSHANPWYGRIGIGPRPRGHGSMPTRGVGLRAPAYRRGHLARIGCSAIARRSGADHPDDIRHSVASWWYSLARCVTASLDPPIGLSDYRNANFVKYSFVASITWVI